MLPIKKLASLVLLLGVAACATIPPPDNARRDVLLNHFFTPEAARVLKRVPLRYGDLHDFGGVAIGNDLGSRILGFTQGFGNRRQVIVNYESDDITLFHEYVHQAQYSGLISAKEFRERYAVFKRDKRFAYIAKRWDRYLLSAYGPSPALAALLYRRGIMRERIAFLIEGWMMGKYDLPDYMLDVYRPAVRFEARKSL